MITSHDVMPNQFRMVVILVRHLVFLDLSKKILHSSGYFENPTISTFFFHFPYNFQIARLDCSLKIKIIINIIIIVELHCYRHHCGQKSVCTKRINLKMND